MIPIVCFLAAIPLLTPASASLEERFANPSGECRLLPIWHGGPYEQAEKRLDALVRQGFGGIACNMPWGPVDKPSGQRYVEDESAWPGFVRQVELAKKAGLSLWLYDEWGWPSGSAGDIVLREHPELEQTGWLYSRADVKGGAKVELQVPPGRFCAAIAAELDAAGKLTGKFVDISSAVRDDLPVPEPFARARTKPVDAEGRPKLGLAKTRAEIKTGPLVWEAPAGVDCRVYAVAEDYVFENTQLEGKGMPVKFRYPNPLVKAATERFLEVNHGAYAKRLGGNLGAFFTSTFCDEPSINARFSRAMPYCVIPSAPGLAERYRARTDGRDLVRDIPYLADEAADGETSGRLRIAFWDEVGLMYAENFYGTISKWCRAHGFLSGGHLMGEESFAFHVAGYGNFFRCLKTLDCPSVDCLYSDPARMPLTAALYAGSARELVGAKRAMVEISSHVELHSPKPREVSEDEIQGALNRMVWSGINTFTSYYEHYRYPDEVWRAVNLRTARAATVFSEGGHSAAPVAVLLPIKDMMRVHVPLSVDRFDGGTPIRALQDVFDGAVKSLYEAGRCFLVIDEETVEKAEVRGDELAFGDLRWKVLLLPGVKTLSAPAKAKLQAFKKAGGVLLKTDAGTDAAETVDAVLEPDVDFRHFAEKGPNPIRTAHRRTAAGDVFFVMNDSPKPSRCSLRLCGDPKDVTLWDPDDGSRSAPVLTKGGRIRLALPPYRAVVLSAKVPCAVARRKAGAVRTHQAIPCASDEPEASVKNMKANFASTGKDAWQMSGVLEEGGKDTSHFISWKFPEGSVPDSAEGLVLTLTVPADSETAPRFCVLLHVRGGSYLYVGQKMDRKGVYRLEIPFSEFKSFGAPFGFVPSDLRGLAVGFGGYVGQAGDKVSFTVTRPAACR
ncbi:MAG: hypothetical protein IKE55_08950 [Kiritimatiellae bacterium]|nr:hypothetical protein [Kiritimatiellia bacterium]